MTPAPSSSTWSSAPEAVTSVERSWPVPPPVSPLQPARPGVLASPLSSARTAPSLGELTDIARAINSETTWIAAAQRLQREAARLTRSTEALFLLFDWPRRAAWSVFGVVTSEQVKDLVAAVAGSGRRSVMAGALIEPIGPAPARAVLALRKPTGAMFSASEIAIVSTLASGVASAIDRLIASARP